MLKLHGKYHSPEETIETGKVKEDRNNYFLKHFKNMEENNDLKGTYKLLKKQAGWATGGNPSSFLLDGKLETSPRKLAETQMNFFKNKTQQLLNELTITNDDPLEILNKTMEKWENSGNREKFKLRNITELESLSILKELGNTTASGMDGIDAVSLKAIATHIYKPLTHLVNLSISSKKIANKWKLAKIIPLHKGKGKSKLDPSSYRPISLLPVLSKITERAVQKQLSLYMKTTKQMHFNQHSYREAHSTTTALAQLADLIFEATDKNLISTITAIDQSAAFDTVTHSLLLRKLDKYNFHSDTVEWFSNYLEYRTQCVEIGNKLSTMKSVKMGVPQGSVLGPMLYAIFVNELPEVVKDPNCQNILHNNKEYLFDENCPQCGTVICYADDSTIFSASNSREWNQLKLIDGLEKMGRFLSANRLSINKTKTMISEIMIKQKRSRLRGSPPELVTHREDGTEKIIKSLKECRLLGGTFQDNLSWNAHIETGEEALVPEARKKLGVLKHLGKRIPERSKKLLAEGLVVSRLRYLIPTWGGTTEKYLKIAQTLLNDTARYVSNKNRRTKTIDLMKYCNWMTVKEMRDYHSILLMWRIVRLEAPKHLADKITVTQDDYLETTYPRLQTTSQGFRWRTVNLWNTLPADMRGDETLISFKKNVRRWIVEQRDMDPD